VPGRNIGPMCANGKASTAWSSGRRMGVAPGFEREVTTMIDSVLNLLFRCPHKRLTRPVTPISKDGKPHGDTYVVCLACGKQFAYDLKEMRIGKPLPSSADFGVLPPGMPGPHKSKIKLALGIGMPLGIVIGSVLSSRLKRVSKQPDAEKNKPAKPASEQPGSDQPS
jgi:hypothetical protein